MLCRIVLNDKHDILFRERKGMTALCRLRYEKKNGSPLGIQLPRERKSYIYVLSRAVHRKGQPLAHRGLKLNNMPGGKNPLRLRDLCRG